MAQQSAVIKMHMRFKHTPTRFQLADSLVKKILLHSRGCTNTGIMQSDAITLFEYIFSVITRWLQLEQSWIYRAKVMAAVKPTACGFHITTSPNHRRTTAWPKRDHATVLRGKKQMGERATAKGNKTDFKKPKYQKKNNKKLLHGLTREKCLIWLKARRTQIKSCNSFGLGSNTI